MLQRAASNAYSWWWASHIRTKQSKWLDNNLQEMEQRVKDMLKIIEEDGDSFARKAEMYFRKRPELIHFVQETYKSYRALAERYDHLSGELQKANNTIASVFPDQVQFGLDDEDEDHSPKARPKRDVNKHPKLPQHPSRPSIAKKEDERIPPKPMPQQKPKDIKIVTGSSQDNKSIACASPKSISEKGKEEINKLQKEILVLQTEKEFVKGSYEIGVAKYWDIQKNISELQEKVCSLEDEYCDDAVIEDDEARALMAVTALKSCETTLFELHENHKGCIENARKESHRIKNSKDKLWAIRRECGGQPQEDMKTVTSERTCNENMERQLSILNQARLDLQTASEKVKKNFEVNSEMSILDLAENIDELVSKVMELEPAVSSQTAQIQRLVLENDELQKNIQSLEDHKNIDGNNSAMSDKLRKSEDKLHKVQDLDKALKDESVKLQKHITEACVTFKVLTETLQSTTGKQVEVKMEDSNERGKGTTPISEREGHTNNMKEENIEVPKQNLSCTSEEDNVKATTVEVSTTNPRSNNNLKEGGITGMENCKMPCKKDHVSEGEVDSGTHNIVKTSTETEQEDKKNDGKENHESGDNIEQPKEVPSSKGSPTEKVQELKKEVSRIVSLSRDQDLHAKNDNGTKTEQEHDDSSTLNCWQQLFLKNGLEDREKILLTEYTSILRNFKDTKRKLADAEKKNQEHMFETMANIRNLKSTILMRDDEINSLRQQLKFLEADRNGQHAGSHKIKHSTEFTTSVSEISALISKEKEDGIHEASDAKEEREVAETARRKPSEIEEKFRRDIDELLEENLEFWLRFSSSFQQIQKYRMAVEGIQLQIPKLKYSRKKEGSSSSTREQSSTKSESKSSKKQEVRSSSCREHLMKPEATAIYKQLGDLDTDFSVWIEQNALLNEELQSRFASLCNIKDEIVKVSQEQNNVEGKEVTFSTYQASKFQGEILNMQQENNKVADELQAGLDHVRSLQAEVQRALARLKDDFDLSSSKSNNNNNHPRNSSSKAKVPLKSFLFTPKPKKPSLLSCMSPAFQKQFSDFPS